MTNIQTNGKDNFLSYIFIIISIILISFVVYPYTNNITLLEEENESNVIKIDKLKVEKEKLEGIKVLLEEDQSTKDYVAKYLNSTDENKIIDFFYDYSNNSENGISIDNLSIAKGTIGLKGFNEAKIQLSLEVGSEKSLLEFIDFLRSETSEYKFFINEITYKIGTTENFKLELPLTVYYK